MRMSASIVAVIVMLGGWSLAAQTSASQKLTGVVSDAMCGQTHTMKGMSAADCTRMCVKAGQKYALVAGKTVYILDGHEADLDKYAGQKVVLTGAVNRTSVTVKSVAPSK